MRATITLLLVWMSACSSEISGHRAAVIQGTPAVIGQHPWTVAVVNVGRSGTGGLCSGTLISDYAVLTAKHCVFQEIGGRWEPLVPSDLRVLDAHDINRADGIVEVMNVYEIRTTPGGWGDADIGEGRDIAVVLLPRKLAGNIEPRGVATSRPAPGTEALIVGFGIHNEATEPSGQKYWGMTTIEAVGSVELRAGGASWSCQGDSGGPLIVGDEVVAVTSWGLGGCGRFSQHFYTLTSAHRALIEQAAAFEPPCEPATEGCDGEDNDCDDLVDEGCTALGDGCMDDSECSNGRCDDVLGTPRCVRDCDPRASIPMCPFGFSCEATGCGMGRCIAGDPGPHPDGEPCTSVADCASSRCTLVAGMMRCGRQCDPAMGGCQGTVCESTGDGCGTCVPYELSTGPRPFGAPCESRSMCQSGDCLVDGGGAGFCTEPCSESDACESGYHCRDGRCRAGDLAAPGGACVTGEDCGLGGECVDVDGDRFCAISCDAGCESGFTCAETSAGQRCVADGLPLGMACAANEECRTGICAGVCTRICDSAPCPTGFECRPAGPAMGCFPALPPEDEGGGCSAVGAPATGAMALVLASLVTLARRRYRR